MKYALKSSTVQSAIALLGAYSGIAVTLMTGVYDQLPPRVKGIADTAIVILGPTLTGAVIKGRSRRGIIDLTWRLNEAGGDSVPPEPKTAPNVSPYESPPSVAEAVETLGQEYIEGVPASLLEDLELIKDMPTPTMQAAKDDRLDSGEVLDLDLDSLEGAYRVLVIHTTKLKTTTDQSSQEGVTYQTLEKDRVLVVDHWECCKPPNQHVRVVIDEYASSHGGEFFLYEPHIRLMNLSGQVLDLKGNTDLTPQPAQPVNKTPLHLPGYESTFYLQDWIANTHFTWAEATKWGQRIPENKGIVDNILEQAKALEDLRSHLGVPLICTSWYRDPATNRAVGGAKNSSHLTGSATDICSPSMDIHELQEKVLNFWVSGGIGLGANIGFVHVASDGWLRTWPYPGN